MFTRTSPATRPRDAGRRCTGAMPEAFLRSVPAPVRRTGRRRSPNGSRADALAGPESGHPSPRARAMPVLVACVTLLAMLYAYSGWHR
jgi:hypothetical protein